MTNEHIAAAHAETKTCNAAASDSLFNHSLACRTRAAQKGPKPVVLTVIDGGDEDRPDACSRCEVCSLEICACASGEHVIAGWTPGTTVYAAAAPGLCVDCDVCGSCGTWLQRPGRGAPVVRARGRYCSEACAADDFADETAEAPAFTWDRAVEVMTTRRP